MNFSARHVVVSGGGTGVGATIAHAFANKNAKVTIIGRSEASLVAQGLAYVACDVTNPRAVYDALDQARKNHGPVDIAIANAGAAISTAFGKMSSADLTAMLDVNLVGVFNLWQAAFLDMKAVGWGRMIAIASTAGLKGYPYVCGYCAAKHGVVGLTRGLALELASTGITVNAICPGFVETPMLERSIANIVEKTGMSKQDAANTLKSANPQQRFIETEEVAASALWLCTEAARSINGHALSLSGGEV